jgi:dTDP-4-dehydrorhamnose 3,5-epimerase
LKFVPTALAGAFVIEPEAIEDDRGFFARSFCENEFRAHGLNSSVVQCNISFNRHRGTLRGMHYQAEPHGEAKLVRCTRGIIYDVIVDLRPDFQTFGAWVACELSADNRKMLYVPEGCAHGFQTLEDECEVFYQMSTLYHAPSARGARWNDPAFAIEWPVANPILSDRDASYPDFKLVR